MTDFYEQVVAAAKSTDPDAEPEPTASDIVSEAIGKPRGVKVRTGTHTYEIEEQK